MLLHRNALRRDSYRSSPSSLLFYHVLSFILSRSLLFGSRVSGGAVPSVVHRAGDSHYSLLPPEFLPRRALLFRAASSAAVHFLGSLLERERRAHFTSPSSDPVARVPVSSKHYYSGRTRNSAALARFSLETCGALKPQFSTRQRGRGGDALNSRDNKNHGLNGGEREYTPTPSPPTSLACHERKKKNTKGSKHASNEKRAGTCGIM